MIALRRPSGPASRSHRTRLLFALANLIALAFAVRAVAAGPEVRSLLPAGGQCGATFEVSASGKFPKWPVQAWVDHAGLTIKPAGEQGKLVVTIAADAVPGLYWIRLHDADGASPPLPFVVGTLGETVEQEPNNSPRKAQAVSAAGVVVNGRLTSDVDTFSVHLRKGQTLVASLAGHETLGSPMDAVLQIVAPRGNVLAFNHDQRGLDPQIEFAAPADGDYLARVFAFPSAPNSTIGFAGGDQFVYRLTLTTGPFVDYPWPLAVTRGRETRVDLVGWNIPESSKTVTVREEGETGQIADPRLANVVPLVVEPHNTLLEVEPNGRATPQPIGLPATITGRIESRGDVDVFAFDGKKGEALVFRLESRSLGYPLDAVLEVADAAGKSLARVDDVGSSRDALLAFSPPTDGSYRIAVSDLNHQGSSRHVYLLRATRAQADFEITADAHAYPLTIGKPTEVTLSIARQNGFEEDLAIRVVGLPEHVTAAPAQSVGKGDTAKSVKLSLTASQGPFSGPVRIIGESTGTSKRSRAAEAAIPGQTARTRDLWLTVAGPANP